MRFLPSFSIVFSPPLLYPLAVQEQEKQPRVMSSPTVVRALIWVSGLVQGVAYRAFTQRAASQQGLRGGVRNRPRRRAGPPRDPGPGARLDRRAAEADRAG